MEDPSPADKARRNARQLIENIAREHTLNGTIFGTKFESLVNNCLEILSNQLYQKSTHFLLELIQNADDNIYKCETPSLSFFYKPGCLRIDCNEIGFNASNVSAICGISQSTKSGKTSDGEFIGEKGIGFKSVFKAADVVSIASNEFEFKFDRTKPLGVITPIWEEFPETRDADQTSIFLKLSPTYDEKTLIEELENFDTNLLIFLRRIQEINIQISRTDEKLWKKHIRKRQFEQNNDRIVHLQAGDETLRYLVRTHIVLDLPKEIKRPEWTQTKILLGFPIPESLEEPLLRPQNVYAFLPIRNYGFKFLIQADFLLTASREEIESTLPWNQRIRNGLAEAILLSMFHFNDGVLRYTWPYYLPTMSIAMSGFFEPTIEAILQQIQHSPVFESCAGNMVIPSTLTHATADFCADGEPFALCEATKDHYLSPKYPVWVIDAMTCVGVSRMSPRQFLEDLSVFITTETESFRNKTAEWHAQLAAALVKLSTDSELMPRIQDLPIIPLNDGTWTETRDRTIFFAKGETSLSIPEGIRVLIIDADAESDPSRRTLFTSLGVKAWEASEICRLIVKVHSSKDFQPDQLATTQIISHAVFLYQASWQPPKGTDLWFATARGERYRGREMYIAGNKSSDSASGRLFTQLEKRFPVMHSDYLTTLASESGWPEWLVQNLGLSRIPRLVAPVVEPRPQPTEMLAAAMKSENALFPLDDANKRDKTEQNLESGSKFEDVLLIPGETPRIDLDFATTSTNTEQAKELFGWGTTWGTVNPADPENPWGMSNGNWGDFSTQKSDEKLTEMNNGIRDDDDWGFDFGKRKNERRSKARDSGAKEEKLAEMTDRIQDDDDGWGFSYGQKKKERTRAPTITIDSGAKEEKPSSPTVEPKDDLWGSWGTTSKKKKKKRKEQEVGKDPPPPEPEPALEETVDGEKAEEKAEEKVEEKAEEKAEDDDPWGSFTLSKKKKKKGKKEQEVAEDTPAQEPEPVLGTTAGGEKAEEKALDDDSWGSAIWATRTKRKKKKKGTNDYISCPVAGCSESWWGDLANEQELAAHMSTAHPETCSPEDGCHNNQDIEIESAGLKEPLFNLSEEFAYMLRECDSSDVLELLRENWHHYSQWVDGAHMKWQGEDFITASSALKNKIGASSVRTMRGVLPLNESVLGKLDTHLEQGRLIPALDIKEPEQSDWNMLSYFGVLMKADVDYYLRCLIALSKDPKPDIDTIAYIYEQIQSKYTGNEDIIRAAFYNTDLVFIASTAQNSDEYGTWTRIEDCVSREIDVESAYSSCSYLFRCLVSPSGDPIGGLVHTMTLINSSSKLEDISRLFCEVSKLLKDVSTSKAALLLKPLQNKPIIPVINGSGRQDYDTLLDVHDRSWYIPDQANFVESFTGVVPLLAFANQDLPAIEDMFRVLRIEGRRMSKMVTSQTLAMGETRSDFRHTDTFRAKSPFIKALIPRNHPSEANIRRQITNLRVRIATAVSEIFTMVTPDKQEISGNPITGHVSISSTDDTLTLIMTEETATAECPSHELISSLADICGIKDQKHISLLFTTLSNLPLKSINTAFVQQGIKVEGLLLPDEPKANKNIMHAVQRVDGMRMPSPFNEKMLHGMSLGQAQPERIKFGFQAYGSSSGLNPFSNGGRYNEGPDRRLPMVDRVKGVGNTYSNIPLSELVRKQKEFDGWEEMQYLGENMVARLLDIHLGSTFHRARDWTSFLRTRAGHQPLTSWGDDAAFTLTEAQTIDRMTEFVTTNGISRGPDWQERLRRNSPAYHVDVAVSVGGSDGRFVIQAKWLERMTDYKIPTDPLTKLSNVYVLIRAARAYSEVDFSLEIHVDPWYLIDEGHLDFNKNWLLTASLNKDPEQYFGKVSSMGAESDVDRESSSESDLSGLANDDGWEYSDERLDDTFSNEKDVSDVSDVVVEQNQLVLYRRPDPVDEAGELSIKGNSEPSVHCALPQYTVHLPWTQSSTIGILQRHEGTLHTTGSREMYLYRALQPGFMRLLYLLPGKDGEPLRAVLNHMSCSEAGKYQALSYVWGSSECTEEINTPDGIIAITSSLYKALQALRQADTAIMIWADAVCINQTDHAEKARQIRLMPQIFQACECAYAFLSEGTPEIDEALEMLMQVRARTVLEEHQRTKNDGSREDEWPRHLPRIPRSWSNRRIPALHSLIWSSVQALFALPYFRRAWIIQEVVAAADVKIVCGKWLIEWKDLYAAVFTIDREVQIAEHDEGISELRVAWEPFTALAAQREWEARQTRWSLLMLLEHFRYAQSTLSRDRLFALVGLAADGNDAEFEPDYDSTFPSIVQNFARAFVRQGRGIQLLYRAGLTSTSQDDKFPSWIPDWTVPRPVGLHDSSDTELTFSACGPQPPSVILGPGSDELSVEGYDMDEIAQLSVASNTEPEWHAYFTEIDAMVDAGVLSGTMGPRDELKWKVPIAAAPFPRSAGAGSTDLKKSYVALREWLGLPALSTAAGSGAKRKMYGNMANAQRSYITCLKGTLKGWRFVVTKRGYVGVVPTRSQVGDVVAVMKGGCVPFVVRKSDRAGVNIRWRLVGECYVHGVMRGEGLFLPGVKERTFVLH